MNISMDTYSYESRLYETNPIVKLLFALSILFVCISSNSILVYILVMSIMFIASVFISGVNGRVYLYLYRIPIIFITLSTIGIVLNFSKNASGIVVFDLFGLYVSITKIGINTAVHLFLKAFGAVSCLYFIIVSTTMSDFIWTLYKIKLPKLLVEIMFLIYRFIFVLMSRTNTIQTAQKARLGYGGIKQSFYSLGSLMSSVFVISFKKADDLYNSMESRCYEGEFFLIEKESYKFNRKCRIQIFLILILAVSVYGVGKLGDLVL